MNKRLDEVEKLTTRLVELVARNGLAEVTTVMSSGTEKVKVRVRGREAISQRSGSPPVAATGSPASEMVAPAPTAASDPDILDHPGVVPSPMVGTVYLQPEPGSAKFVEVGQTVEAEQELLIIEAMKTMNRIGAPRAGTVRRIFVEDGAPVEFGAPLMIID